MPAQIRQSKQRQVILSILTNTTSHPTAEEVYLEAKKTIPDISLGTVYRNLNFLADHEMIIRLKGVDQTDHFDANTSPHYHFFCDCCKKVMDIFPDENMHEKLTQSVSSYGKILYSRVDFIGVCKDCEEVKH